MGRWTFGEVRAGSFDHWGGLRRVGGPSGRSGLGWGPSGRSLTVWETLEEVRNGSLDPLGRPGTVC